MASGLIRWSMPRATFGLVVRDDIVVDCAPYARRWALGRDARVLWRQGAQQGVVIWLPEANQA